MDLFYTVAPNGLHQELKYSLRSIEQNLEYKNIYVVGFQPKWVANTCYIYREQNQLEKPKNVYENLLAGLSLKEIDENIIIMMDDVYVLQKLNKLPVYRGNLLQEHPTKDVAGQTLKLLKELKCKQTYSYEFHTPFPVEKDKLQFILKKANFEEWGYVFWRSLYGNYFKPEWEYGQDSKQGAEAYISENMIFTSSADKDFSKGLRPLLAERFPKRSNYEKN